MSQEQSSVSSAISSSNSVSSTEQSSSSSASVNSTSKTATPSRGGCSGNIGISVFLLPMLALALVFIVRRTKKQ